MDNEEIKNYILKYKNSYSKEQIENALIESGVNKHTINLIYSKTNSKSQDNFCNDVPIPNSKNIKPNNVVGKIIFWIIFLGIGIFAIPFIGFLAFCLIIFSFDESLIYGILVTVLVIGASWLILYLLGLWDKSPKLFYLSKIDYAILL